MADARFVPKSVGKRSVGKVLGGLALVGAMAGAGALFVWGCTDSSGGANFVEPKRPFTDGSVADSGSDASASDAATDSATADGSSDGSSADLAGDR
ncbi:MAG TPA: hypothetical protein VH853_25295 [Polyangia bacterium]|jgi:hypothetical protein|nr:hypothetical protein [Polyangia bacterium]